MLAVKWYFHQHFMTIIPIARSEESRLKESILYSRDPSPTAQDDNKKICHKK